MAPFPNILPKPGPPPSPTSPPLLLPQPPRVKRTFEQIHQNLPTFHFPLGRATCANKHSAAP
ncbi:MAG: hypothetical protein ACTS4T_01090 [Candidatus Hodgkinia cicadicola]